MDLEKLTEEICGELTNKTIEIKPGKTQIYSDFLGETEIYLGYKDRKILGPKLIFSIGYKFKDNKTGDENIEITLNSFSKEYHAKILEVAAKRKFQYKRKSIFFTPTITNIK